MKLGILVQIGFIALLGSVLPVVACAGDGELTLIHMGDLHGHLIPRPNMREGDVTEGEMVGGLAYVYDQVKKIRARQPNNLLVNTGDTIQGSAEALYSKGGAMVDILNLFGIDAFAIGNWDYLYGTERFRELFAGVDGREPLANWNALAANLYYATLYEFPETRYPELAGTRVVPPYMVRDVGGVRVGIVGLTADRGPQAVSTMVIEGFYMTPGEEELEAAVPLLREKEKVDLIVLISERGLAANLELVETIPGIDVVLSSDMHEETWKVLEAKSGTLLVEEGQDGTMLGEMNLVVKDGKIADWDFTAHRITTTNNQPAPEIQAKIDEIRAAYVNGAGFVPHVNPINGSVLRTPIDTVIGHTKVALHRSNYAEHDAMPAVVEGSSHDFLSDAFRGACESDVGMIRGFRYGTHVAPGPVKLEDIYHFIPIGPQVACGLMSGDDIKLIIENGAQSSLTQWVGAWGGGWIIGMSGVTYDLDPYNEWGFRTSNVRVNGEALDPEKYYSVGGYWYVDNPGMINRKRALEIKVLRDPDGGIVDATAVVAYYLRSLPDRTANPEMNRIRLLRPLPKRIGPNAEIQPLAGVPRPEHVLADTWKHYSPNLNANVPELEREKQRKAELSRASTQNQE